MTDRMHINWDIIVRRILNESSEDENKLVDDWLAEDEANREYYRKAKHYFDVYYTGEETREVDSEGAWDEFVAYTGKSSRKLLWKKVVGYAAAVIILLGVGFTYWMSDNRVEQPKTVAVNQPLKPGTMKAFLIFNSGEHIALTDSSVLEQVVEEYKQKMVASQGQGMLLEKEEYNTLIIPRGGEYNLVLADGTSVKLNADSKLSFPDKFIGKERRVRLEGEALFHVAKDSEHPFIVETKEVRTRVLGTSFNIKAYDNEESVYTTLLTGKVEVSAVNENESVILTPGMQCEWEKDEHVMEMKKVDAEKYVAWKQGQFMFDNENITVVTRVLERWYGLKFIYNEGCSRKHTFSGCLSKDDSLESILETLTYTGGPRFIMGKNVVYVKDKI